MIGKNEHWEALLPYLKKVEYLKPLRDAVCKEIDIRIRIDREIHEANCINKHNFEPAPVISKASERRNNRGMFKGPDTDKNQDAAGPDLPRYERNLEIFKKVVLPVFQRNNRINITNDEMVKIVGSNYPVIQKAMLAGVRGGFIELKKQGRYGEKYFGLPAIKGMGEGYKKRQCSKCGVALERNNTSKGCVCRPCAKKRDHASALRKVLPFIPKNKPFTITELAYISGTTASTSTASNAVAEALQKGLISQITGRGGVKVFKLKSGDFIENENIKIEMKNQGGDIKRRCKRCNVEKPESAFPADKNIIWCQNCWDRYCKAKDRIGVLESELVQLRSEIPGGEGVEV